MRRSILFLFLPLALGLFAVRPASAAELDSYRAQGIIAERFDGYVELKSANAPPEAKSLVESVNKKRAEIYKKRAAAENVPVAEVGKIYANQIFGDAPAGTYFRKPDGSYIRK